MPETRTGPLAVISDIHGNADALAVVLKDVAANRCRAVVCLGDVVGYGPEPGTCVRLVRECAATVVAGNHEAMLLEILREGPSSRERTNGIWKALALCRKDLTAAERSWIRRLPFTVTDGDLTFVHGSLHRPHDFDYIHEREAARLNFAAQETRISFHGHTHLPVVWEERDGEISGCTPGEAPIQLDPACRYAIGVGSVGQPRDGDPRAAYALYDPGTSRLSIRRLDYDIPRVQKRFRERGLTGFHHDRLAGGE